MTIGGSVGTWAIVGAGLVLVALVVAWGRPKQSWSVFYRGSLRNRDGSPAQLTVRGDMIPAATAFGADNGYLPIAEGRPGQRLSPRQALTIEIVQDDRRLAHTVRLADVIDKPLQGYVELMAERDHLRLRICRYRFGRTLSIGTGQTHQSVTTVAERTVPWDVEPAGASPATGPVA